MQIFGKMTDWTYLVWLYVFKFSLIVYFLVVGKILTPGSSKEVLNIWSDNTVWSKVSSSALPEKK